MFLELFNNAFMDSSIFYLYFGVILMTIGIMYFVNLHHNNPIVRDYFFVDKHQSSKIDLSAIGKTLIINEPFITWLIITFKRTDENDGKEDVIASYFKNEFKIRGGQLWKETAYSHSLESIVF